MWFSNTLGVVYSNGPAVAPPAVKAYYDMRAEVVAVRIREGEPKYVAVGRGNFVIYGDDRGVWAVELEVKEWEGVDAVGKLKKAGVELW